MAPKPYMEWGFLSSMCSVTHVKFQTRTDLPFRSPCSSPSSPPMLAPTLGAHYPTT
ncbi:hypothetical protein ID866_9888 [Astraeus odoratus]|nr:hypothetical protein ID866_9888 [Astraeus odoratus]